MPLHSWIVVGPVVDWTSRCVQASAVLLTRGESGLMPGMSKTGWPLRSVVGSGQVGMPWERMQRAKFSRPVMICGTWAWDGWRSGAQARWAAWNREVLTPTCCGVTLGTPPRLAGSGKSGTPWERMHWEKATAWELTSPTVVDEPPP